MRSGGAGVHTTGILMSGLRLGPRASFWASGRSRLQGCTGCDRVRLHPLACHFGGPVVGDDRVVLQGSARWVTLPWQARRGGPGERGNGGRCAMFMNNLCTRGNSPTFCTETSSQRNSRTTLTAEFAGRRVRRRSGLGPWHREYKLAGRLKGRVLPRGRPE